MTAGSRRSRRRFRSVVLLPILAAVATAACDSTGSAVAAINESDHDVVVDVRAGAGMPSKSVPAHTQGTVFNTFGGPEGHWSVVVFDGSCRRLAEFPIQTNGSMIHIHPDGEVAFEPGDPTFVAGIDVASLADAQCPRS